MSKLTSTSLKLILCVTFISCFAGSTGLMLQFFTWFAVLYALVNVIRLNNLTDASRKGNK